MFQTCFMQQISQTDTPCNTYATNSVQHATDHEMNEVRSISDDSYLSLVTDGQSKISPDMSENQPSITATDQFIEDHMLEIRNSPNIEFYLDQVLEPTQSQLCGAKYNMMSQYQISILEEFLLENDGENVLKNKV